jgi:hypothetical protein
MSRSDKIENIIVCVGCSAIAGLIVWASTNIYFQKEIGCINEKAVKSGAAIWKPNSNTGYNELIWKHEESENE